MSIDVGGFSASLLLELAQTSRAIYPGPLNHKNLSIKDKKIDHQRYVHGSFNRGFCRVFANDDAVVVAFRGSRERVDWWSTNIKAFPVPLRDCGLLWPVFVHRGFQSALDFTDKSTGRRSLDAICSVLDEFEVGERELYITGHSLGGAIAVIFASKLRSMRPDLVAKNLRGVVTFGAPSAGLAGFYKNYGRLHDLTLRVVNESDVVPYTPPIGYRHVGRSFWLKKNSIKPDPGWRLRLLYSLSLFSPKTYALHHSMTEYIAGIRNFILGHR